MVKSEHPKMAVIHYGKFFTYEVNTEKKIKWNFFFHLKKWGCCHEAAQSDMDKRQRKAHIGVDWCIEIRDKLKHKHKNLQNGNTEWTDLALRAEARNEKVENPRHHSTTLLCKTQSLLSDHSLWSTSSISWSIPKGWLILKGLSEPLITSFMTHRQPFLPLWPMADSSHLCRWSAAHTVPLLYAAVTGCCTLIFLQVFTFCNASSAAKSTTVQQYPGGRRKAQAERWSAWGHKNWQHQTEAAQESCILTHTLVLSPGFLPCEKHSLTLFSRVSHHSNFYLNLESATLNKSDENSEPC